MCSKNVQLFRNKLHDYKTYARNIKIVHKTLEKDREREKG